MAENSTLLLACDNLESANVSTAKSIVAIRKWIRLILGREPPTNFRLFLFDGSLELKYRD